MNKIYYFNTLALTAILFSLSGCKKANRCPCEDANKITPVIESGDLTTEQAVYALSQRIDEISVKTSHGIYGGNNPPHLDTYGLFLDVEYLYWKATEDGLEFAEVFEPQESSFDLEEKSEGPHGHWDSGFRLGLGYLFGCHDAWELFFDWTAYGSKSHKSVHNEDLTKTVLPLWGNNLMGLNILTGRAEWKTRFNCFDLELARNYFVSKALAVRPAFGLRGALIIQNYDADYFSNYASSPSAPLLGSASMDAKNNFKGLGIKAGTDLLWHLGSHVGFYGTIAGSLLYGHTHVKQNFQGNAALFPTVAVPYAIDFANKTSNVRPNIETALGLFFESSMDCGSHVMVSVGYELSTWFSQLQLERTNITPTTTIPMVAEDRNPSDLSFNGYTFKLRFDF